MEKFNLTDAELLAAVRKGMNDADNIGELSDRISLEVLSLISLKNTRGYQPLKPEDVQEKDISGVDFRKPLDGTIYNDVDISHIKFTDTGHVDFNNSEIFFGKYMSDQETSEYINNTIDEYMDIIKEANNYLVNNRGGEIEFALDIAKKGLLEENPIKWAMDAFSDRRKASDFEVLIRKINSLAREAYYIYYRYASINSMSYQINHNINLYHTFCDSAYNKLHDLRDKRDESKTADYYDQVWQSLLSERYTNGLVIASTTGYNDIYPLSFDHGYTVASYVFENKNDYDSVKAAFNYLRDELKKLRNIDSDDYRKDRLNQMNLKVEEMLEFDDKYNAYIDAKKAWNGDRRI